MDSISWSLLIDQLLLSGKIFAVVTATNVGKIMYTKLKLFLKRKAYIDGGGLAFQSKDAGYIPF